MQQLRLPAFFSLIAALGFVALLNPSNAAAQLAGPLNGATYVTTVRDSSGNFTTRTVLTLHADHTMSVVAADQGGLTFSLPANSVRGNHRVEWSERHSISIIPQRRRCAHRLHDQFRSCPRSSDRHRNTYFIPATRKSLGWRRNSPGDIYFYR